jgi:hypothetical protein
MFGLVFLFAGLKMHKEKQLADQPTVNTNKYIGAFTAENRSLVKAGLFNKDGKLLGRITEIKIK